MERPETGTILLGESATAQREGPQRYLSQYPVRVLRLQFFDVRDQFVLVNQSSEVETNHLVSAKRRLFAGPQCDQHARNDRALRLNFDAVLIVT